MNVSPIPLTPSASAPDQILLRLEWKVIRRLDGLFQGDYRTLFYGDGIDFANLREYQVQDDIRYIDWNVTARTNRLHVRQYVDDREITAWFLVDLSPSMAFGPLDRPKNTLLIDLVATLARLLTRSGNQVGAILYNSRVERTVPPLGGRIQVLRLVREMLRIEQIPSRSMTDLGVLLSSGLNTFKRRSLVFVISDFISQPGWQRSLSLLNQRHEMVAIRLWDPNEIELPDAGWLVVQDSETGEQLQVDTGDPNFRRRFFENARRREDALKADLTRAGVDLYSVSTSEDLVPAIVRMAALRKKRRL